MTIAIIKYNGGNTQSVAFALERLGVTPVITADFAELQNADKIIFPGVGSAAAAMQYLREQRLDLLIPSLQQPVLGICLGMQLLCRFSEEGEIPCLNIFNEPVIRFGNEDKVPHMGWNEISKLSSPLFQGVAERSMVYFVHSFYAAQNDATIACTEYSRPFSAALQKNNFYGVQFHPEKSGKTGERILQNFISL